MKYTTILYPLDDDMSQTNIRKHKDTWKNISKHVNEMKEGEDITFDQLLINQNITEQNYYLAIQSSLNSPTMSQVKYTASDIAKLKDRVIQEDINNPIDAPHLFIQNAKVEEFNEKVHYICSYRKQIQN